MIGRWCGLRLPPQGARRPFTFISRRGFATQTLAHMLDSLVRVSRRVDGHHFVSIVRCIFTSVGATARGPG